MVYGLQSDPDLDLVIDGEEGAVLTDGADQLMNCDWCDEIFEVSTEY